LNKSEFQRVYFGYEEVDKWGDISAIKMQATDTFKEKFNDMVYELLMHCIETARSRDSTCMDKEDLPELDFQPKDQDPQQET